MLYVSATRGREGNWLYVDTHYDPDPQTSHDEATEPATAKEVLAGVLRNEGADVAAHDMIRREQHEAEGMERLSAEYLTLATMPKPNAGTPCSCVRGSRDETSTPSVQARRTVRCSPRSARPRPAAWTSRRPSRNWSPAGP